MNENNENDLLQEIWQAQEIHSVDTTQIAMLAASQRLKQRLYIALDILSLLPFAILFFIDIKFSVGMYIFFACLFVSSLAMILYFLKLRWYAAFGDISNTSNFTQALMKQYKNNALIAKVNKHLGWLSALAAIGVVGTMQVLSDAELGVSLKKIGMVTIIMIGIGIPWCIWAHKRQKRFERKITSLAAMLE